MKQLSLQAYHEQTSGGVHLNTPVHDSICLECGYVNLPRVIICWWCGFCLSPRIRELSKKAEDLQTQRRKRRRKR
jgi:ribosomal protein L37E